MNRREALRTLLSAPPLLWAARLGTLRAQGAMTLESLAPKLTLMSGFGGNIALLQTDDGLVLVDSGIPENAEATDTKARSVAAVPIKVLINTHFHYDHVGGNERLGREGVKIIAHENVLKRVSTPQKNAFFGREFPALAPEGRPKTAFTGGGSLALGTEKLQYQHLPPAHTDGDSTVHFLNTNVFQTGDLFFNGMYPFIDYSAGGSMEGMIADADQILKTVDAKTKIIPGHGPMGTRDDLKAFRDMLAAVNEKVSSAMKGGKTLEQLQAAEPTKDYDAKWGNGFLKPADFVRMLHMGKSGKRS